jgi:ribosome-binding factor A
MASPGTGVSVTRRTERVGESIREELARVLREDATDPRLRLVTLTRVDVAPDLSHALVFWSVMDASGAPSVEEAEAGLDAASAFLRRCLAHELRLRRMPLLDFRHDPSLALGAHTLALLHEIEHEPKDE